MVFYLSLIIGTNVVVIALNWIFNAAAFANVGFIFLWTILSSVVVILIDALIASLFCKCFPQKWYEYDVKRHNPSKKEYKLYEKLGVKNWKDLIWDLGALNGFSKTEVKDPNDPEYIHRFIIECNYGADEHMVSCFAGILIALVIPFKFHLVITLPVFLVNFFLNLLPYMALRYNCVRLNRMYKVLLAKAERAKRKTNTEENK